MSANGEASRRRAEPLSRSGTRPGIRLLTGAMTSVFLTATMPACDGGETAITRGDRFWADSNYDAALAEYRLAVSQSGGDAQSLARAAHAYAVAGQLDEARELYDRLLDRAPGYGPQAVMDYVRLARRARARGDGFGMATAVEAALDADTALALPGLAVAVAEYYAELGQAERALEYYDRALRHAPPDTAARILYEVGLLHEERDRCGAALSCFRAFEEYAAPTVPLAERGPVAEGPRRRRAPSSLRGLLGQARWHIGNCSYVLARRAMDEGRAEQALEHLAVVLELGLPENIQDQAWLDSGELLYALGRYDEALVAYRRVLDLNPSLTGRLVERAQRRIDEIRFGTPGETADTVPGSRQVEARRLAVPACRAYCSPNHHAEGFSWRTVRVTGSGRRSATWSSRRKRKGSVATNGPASRRIRRPRRR